MNEVELNELLGGEPIEMALDFKTLVIDLVREMSEEELLGILHQKLPGLSSDFVKDYLFMKR